MSDDDSTEWLKANAEMVASTATSVASTAARHSHELAEAGRNLTISLSENLLASASATSVSDEQFEEVKSSVVKFGEAIESSNDQEPRSRSFKITDEFLERWEKANTKVEKGAAIAAGVAGLLNSIKHKYDDD